MNVKRRRFFASNMMRNGEKRHFSENTVTLGLKNRSKTVGKERIGKLPLVVTTGPLGDGSRTEHQRVTGNEEKARWGNA